MSQLRRVPACLVASVTMVVCPLALAAPPESDPGGPTSEASPAEPEPSADDPSEPATPDQETVEAAPVEAAPVEPPPAEPPPAQPTPDEAPLPTWSDEIPSYDEAVPAIEEPPLASPEPPPDGNGSTTAGAMLLAGGMILTASSVVLIFEDQDEVGVWITGATLGSLVIPAGMALLITGAVKRKRYESFRLEHHPPPSGSGMLAGGTLAMSAGAFGMLMGGISLGQQDADDLPYGQVLLSLGAASIATGVALTVIGAKRRQKYNLWDRPPATPTISVLSGPQLRPAGATIGVAGRF